MKVVGSRKNKSVDTAKESIKAEALKAIEATEKKKIYFSASKVQTFKNCPLQYKFKYVDKLDRPETDAPHLTFGITMHKAMEYIYNCIARGEKPDRDISEVIVDSSLSRVFCSTMDDNQWEAFRHQAIISIKKYMNRRTLFSPMVIGGNVCTELDFGVQDKERAIQLKNPITNEKLDGVYIVGSIDLIDEDSNIIDFKTSYKSYTQEKVDTAIQATMYSYAFREMFNYVENGFIYDVIKKNNVTRSNPSGEPTFEKWYTWRNTNHYYQMFLTIEMILKSEKHGIFYPNYPNDGKNCLYCKFKPECQNWCGK